MSADADEDGADRTIDVVGIAVIGLILVMLVTLGLSAFGGGGEATNNATLMEDQDAGKDQFNHSDWAARRVNDSHVRIVHQGNDTAPASNVVIRVDREKRTPRWGPAIQPGESVTIRAARGSQVELFWKSGANAPTLLEQWEL